MYRHIIVYFLVLAFVACKNDSAVKVEPKAVETPTNEVATRTERKVENPIQREAVQEEKETVTSTIRSSNTSGDGKVDTVTVSSVEDLVKNARSNRVIYLEKGKYKLQTELVYYMTKDEQKIIDKRVVDTRSIGGQLFFMGLDNVQIIGKEGAEVISNNPKAVAFFVVRSKNWKISNLTIKKEINGTAELSYISNSQNIEFDGCTFDGGGSYGMYINNVDNLKVNNSTISKCFNGALRIRRSTGINFMNSLITGNECKVPIVNVYESGSTVVFNNVKIINNKKDQSSTFQDSDRIFAAGDNTIRLENCTVQNNVGYRNLGLGMASLSKSRVDGVTIP
ncbi:MAG: right-handed parallel beta-helix repeat-containing protein [Bacteroidota bacterium]